MTLETKRRLVCLIDSGTNTRAGILASMPELDDSDLDYAMQSLDETERILIERGGILSLADAGKDILYLMKEEQKQQLYIVLSVIASIIAAVCGLIDLYRSLAD